MAPLTIYNANRKWIKLNRAIWRPFGLKNHSISSSLRNFAQWIANLSHKNNSLQPSRSRLIMSALNFDESILRANPKHLFYVVCKSMSPPLLFLFSNKIPQLINFDHSRRLYQNGILIWTAGVQHSLSHSLPIELTTTATLKITITSWKCNYGSNCSFSGSLKQRSQIHLI